MERELAQKYEALRKKTDNYVLSGVTVAFSGGVDSALLLKLACMAAGKENTVYAVTVRTRLHPAGDLETAKLMAAEFGAVHKALEMDELAESGIETNPVNRCYLCKRSIFRRIKELAKELGAGCILEGTNADDLHGYRPGVLALRELQIISPLAECGLTKPEIRKLAEYLGISAANRPSSPCLATRLPYGTKISYEFLERIDEGERYLREQGFYNVRLRAHDLTAEVNIGLRDKAWEWQKNSAEDDENKNGRKNGGQRKEKKWLARIEVDREDMAKLLEDREKLVQKIKGLGFSRVTIDLEGFQSGSMDKL